MNDKFNDQNNLPEDINEKKETDQSSASAEPGSEKKFETFEPNEHEGIQDYTSHKTNLKDLIQNKFSEVSAGSGSKGLIIIFLAALMIGGIYLIFSSPEAVKERQKSDKESKIQEKKEELLKTAKAPSTITVDNSSVQNVPQMKKEIAPPAPPQITAPQPPAPPPPPVPASPQAPSFPTGSSNNNATQQALPPQIANAATQSSSIADVLSGEADKRKQAALARRKASIMVTGGGSDGGGLLGGGGDSSKAKSTTTEDKGNADASKAKNKSFLGFDNGALGTAGGRTSAAQTVEATHVGSLERMIAQGKIINAVLESAINTDLPGSLRAIVSRDVFAETGKNILIPKGSRLIGTYNNDTKNGQPRIGVMWNRVIRPDGVDIAIASEGTDELGRSGVAGWLDDKFWLKIGTAVLTSYIVPTVAKKIMNVKDEPVTTTTTTGTPIAGTGPTTSTTSSGSTSSKMLQDTVQKLQDSITKAVEESINTKPTVTVDQGTMVNVYVNKDIIFTPEQVYGATKVLK